MSVLETFLAMQVGGMPLTVAVGSIISVEGFTFMMSPAAAGSVLKALTGQGAVPMSPGAWETLRILQGYRLYVVALFSISDPCLSRPWSH